MLSPFFPSVTGLRLDHIETTPTLITLRLAVSTPTACCPICQQGSRRVHSSYRRTLADLPVAGTALRLHVLVRRFFCRTPQCPRWIFSERLPQLARPHAQRTLRLAATQQQIGLALGGQPGAALADTLAMPVSARTLLRLVRQLVLREPAATPRVLGVDDFAWRKGRTYGTILCDLEHGHPIDLLPDRRADSLAAWLVHHPGVEVISRDRAGAYADGARQGAPLARQIADRFHVLKNLGDALEAVLTRLHAELCTALQPLEPAQAVSAAPPVVVPPAAVGIVGEPVSTDQLRRIPHRRPRRDVAHSAARRAERLTRYNEVQRLHQLGWSLIAIARQLGLNRDTVSKWVHQAHFREHQPHQRRGSQLEAHKEYLQQRWQAGCRNARQLWVEVGERGYPGGYTMVASYMAEVRQAQGVPLRRGAYADRHQPQPRHRPSARQLRWLLLKPVGELNAEEYEQVMTLGRASKEVTVAYGLVLDFKALVRRRQGDQLASWVEVAQASGVPEMGSFARGVLRDFRAVQAGLEEAYSQGPVEGHVNRLKLLKRQSYGRANFDLLRLRVLYAH